MTDAHKPASHGTPEDGTQAMSILPPELAMLEPLPPVPDQPTEPLPKFSRDQVDPEVFAILGGPGATHVMKAAEPEAPTESAEATQAIRIPEPASTQTTVLPAGEPSPEATQRGPARDLAPAETLDQPLPALRTQARPVSQGTVRRAVTFPAPARRGRAWVWIAAILLLLGGGAVGAYVLFPQWFRPAPPPEPPAPPIEAADSQIEPEIPPALRGYFERAQKGDAAAMRMLGVMYYQGLNVGKNPAEGLKWYRKAAEAGSDAAKKDLEALGIK